MSLFNLVNGIIRELQPTSVYFQYSYGTFSEKHLFVNSD